MLKKPGKLTDEEFDLMKQHTIKGANIMRPVAQLKEMLPGIELHHERMDGAGYPYGLHGEQIPTMARIIAVADTLDAITTNRPYQSAMDLDYALERIQSLAISRFDPVVVAALDAAVQSAASASAPPSSKSSFPRRSRTLRQATNPPLFTTPNSPAASSVRINALLKGDTHDFAFRKTRANATRAAERFRHQNTPELPARVEQILTGDRPVDPELLKQLESALLSADIGVRTTKEVLASLRPGDRAQTGRSRQPRRELKSQILKILTAPAPSGEPERQSRNAARHFVVGVNGTGKTTTIGKLANRLKKKAPASCSAPPTPSAPPPSSNSKSGPTAPASK